MDLGEPQEIVEVEVPAFPEEAPAPAPEPERREKEPLPV
jgi:hypothetical protein